MDSFTEPTAVTPQLQAAAVFPVIRHISRRVTPWLAQLPLTANHITAVSMVFGLAAAGCMAAGARQAAIIGALLLVVDYVLDNCDGEIARLKNQCSEFGRRFDSFVDWIVHACFFAALGLGVGHTTGDDIWIWLGGIAALGATINYLLAVVLERRGGHSDSAPPDRVSGTEPSPAAKMPTGLVEWFIFVFRELSRADFCFIVLVLALLDAVWVLLPLAAVGAQVYWMTQCIRGARAFHV